MTKTQDEQTVEQSMNDLYDEIEERDDGTTVESEQSPEEDSGAEQPLQDDGDDPGSDGGGEAEEGQEASEAEAA